MKMKKINASIQSFPDIWKLNDQRLMNLFKKYQKLIHISQALFEIREQRVIALRYHDLKDELSKRGNIA